MKKIALWGFGSLLVLAVLFLGVTILASERVEVVELHTTDSSGAAQTTRVWIVDDGAFQYLRSSSGTSSWLAAVDAGQSFSLTRNGETRRYTAVTRTDRRERINQLMREKYTWGDAIIGWQTGGGANAVPVELHAVP